MKRINIIIMTMLTALIALPAFARDFEYDGLTYTVLDESALTCQTKAGGYAEGKYVAGNAVTGEVVIPATVTDGTNTYTVVKIGDYGFAEASELTAITISEGIKTIGTKAFSYCGALTKVGLPETLVSIEPFAFEFSTVNNVVIPASITEINDGVFYRCSQLKEIQLPETLTSIGTYAFAYTPDNISITLPNSLKTIGDLAFCASGVRAIVLPESLVSIGLGAFSQGELRFWDSDCFLTDVTIPASIEEIGDFAFCKYSTYYKDINVVYNAETPREFSGSLFNDETYTTGTLTMPNATLADIQATAPWNRFTHIVAKDGSIAPPETEENFVFNGITYTILDKNAKTCKVKDYWWTDEVKSTISPEMFAGDVFVIPTTVSDGTDTYTVTEIGSNSFNACDSLKSVKLPEKLQIIGTNAFMSCSSLSSIELPPTLTTIGNGAFSFTKSLTSIDLPASLKYLDIQAFNTSGLTEVTIPEGVTYLSNAVFNYCQKLEKVNLPSTLTAIGGGAFYYCNSLSSLDIKNCPLTTIQYDAFLLCPLEDIQLPSTLAIIGRGAFQTTKPNAEIVFPESLKVIGESAFNNTGLSSISLPASLSFIGTEAFTNNELKEITYAASKPISPVADIFYIEGSESYHYNAFNEAQLNMPNATLAEVESTLPWSLFKRIYASDGTSDPGLAEGKDFEYEGLTFTVIDPETKTCRTKAGNFYYGTYTPGSKVSGDVVIPAIAKLGINDYSVVEIGEYSFTTDSLTSITIPESVITIGNNAFNRCYTLPSITIPESVTTLGETIFDSCWSLKSVELPGSIETMGYGIFHTCDSIVSVTYNAVNPIEGPWETFYSDVYEKATLYMPNASLADIQNITPWSYFKKVKAKDGSVGMPLEAGQDFEYQGIKYTVIDPEAKTCRTKFGTPEEAGNAVEGDITIPSVASDGNYQYNVIEIGEYAFESCTNLTSIKLPESLLRIDDNAFEKCSGLTAIDFPENLEYIGLYAFAGCTGLTSLDIPEKITKIDYMTFDGCSSIETVHLPSSLSILGVNAFQSCSSLKSIDLPETLIRIEGGAFNSCSLTSAILPSSLEYLGGGCFHANSLTSVSLPASLVEIGEEVFLNNNDILTVQYSAENPIATFENVFENHVYENASLEMPYATLEAVQATVPWNMFKHIVAKDGSVGFGAGAGEDFEYEGLWYTVIDADAKTCKTKSGVSTEDSASPGNNVEGDLVIPSKVSDGTYEYTVVEIGEDGFRGCNITSLTLPESVRSIAGAAFFNCEALSTITFSEGLQSIGEIAFNGCKGLTSLSLPTSVTAIGQWAFYYCENLSSVGLPTSLTSIGEFTFHMCNNINIVEYQASTPITAPGNLFTETVYKSATLNMPYATLETVQATVPWNMFQHIVADDGTVEPGLVAGEDFEYEGLWYTVLDTEAMTCKTKEGVFNEDMTSPGNAMQGELVIPSKVSDGNNEYSVVEIGANGFRGSMITSVTLPETVTTIREWAFSYCYYLSSVNLPASLTSIEEYAFNMCNEISQVEYYAANPISVSMTIFEGNVYGNATLNMPNATLETVQATVPWNMFQHIVASDGTVGFMPGEGETVEYGGLFYTILSVNEAEQTGTVTTKAGEGFGVPGNSIYGDVEIPGGFEVDDVYYEVKEIGEFGFAGSDYLTSITLPTAIEHIGMDAFSGCPRLTSLVWQAHNQMPEEAIYSIGNPNLLVYVDSIQFAPSTLDKNVVVMLNASQHFECEKLVLTPGYPFTPLYSFDAHNSSMTKSFRQKTPIDGCGGWETIVLPFDVTDIVTYDDRHLTSFISMTDAETQYPFWLCDANPEGEWNYAESIKAGVPYIISMPNNGEYDAEYCISGNVTFSSSSPMSITPETTAPYAVTWTSGREFRSLWTPLTEKEAANAMGLNVGISNLVGDNGEVLAPGSAFHVGVVPQPLEAYVTRIDGQRAMKIGGGQSSVLLIDADRNLDVRASYGTITVTSATDRTLDICTTDGVRIRTLDLKAGETVTVADLTKGIYIVANRKVTVK